MSAAVNRQIVLEARPNGLPGPDNFALVEGEVPRPGPGQALIRTLYLSIDPAMKGWISTARGYSEPVPLGGVMRSLGVGEVVESRTEALAPGDFVCGMPGWQDYALSDGTEPFFRKLDPAAAPLSTALGVLGLNGLTAYFGLLDAGAPAAGETVVVSTAAGGVGSAVGQIARLQGCRTVGLAGGPAKVALCREAFGYDAAIDYKAADVAAALRSACPDGIDVFFDNTGGPILDAVLGQLNVGARIVVCGTAATASWDPPPTGTRVERAILVARARMQGILIFDYAARYPEGLAALAGWIADGRLVYREDIRDGLEAAPAALADLYAGGNTGKLLVRVRPDPTRTS